jgi:hypothetical protein
MNVPPAHCSLPLQANVARLKAYRSNVVIFPRNVKKPKVGVQVADEVCVVQGRAQCQQQQQQEEIAANKQHALRARRTLVDSGLLAGWSVAPAGSGIAVAAAVARCMHTEHVDDGHALTTCL